jgi:dipeptidyl aminopeptidase/acylaminoacyl peptidase
MDTSPDAIDQGDWRVRFRAPRVQSVAFAGGREDRGLAVASQDGSTIQLFAWDVKSGDLRALTDSRYGVVDGWIDPTGSFVYYLRDVDGSELGHLVRVPFEGGTPQDLTPDLAPYTLRGVGFDRSGATIAFNPINTDGFALYTMDLETMGRTGTVGEPRLLHRDSWENWGALLSAGGDLAACWSTARARGSRRYTVLVFDTATGEQVGELGDGRDAKVVGVRFSPVDGDDRLLASATESGFARPVLWNARTAERYDIPVDGLATDANPGDTEPGDVEPVDWSADGSRLLLCQPAGVQRLSSYDLRTGELRTLSHPNGTYLRPFADGVGFGPDDTIIGIRETAEAPPEVVELDAGTGRRRGALLSSAPAPAGRPWRSVTFTSSDGTPVQAWLATPATGTGPFPTIVEAHGGPHYTEYEHYDPGTQVWLDHGYAWISVNYRGSLGFGRDFAERIWGDLGHWELADLVAGRDWMVREGIARAGEVFIHGGSYGGYLTLLALGKRPDLWVGGIAAAALADLTAAYEHMSDALRGAIAGWMLGTPSERPAAYAKSSPITYASGVTAPVLVVQLRTDTRAPAGQLERYEQRMRELGKEIEVHWLDGGHRSMGPQAWVRNYEKMLTFADRVLTRSRAR